MHLQAELAQVVGELGYSCRHAFSHLEEDGTGVRKERGEELKGHHAAFAAGVSPLTTPHRRWCER